MYSSIFLYAIYFFPPHSLQTFSLCILRIKYHHRVYAQYYKIYTIYISSYIYFIYLHLFFLLFSCILFWKKAHECIFIQLFFECKIKACVSVCLLRKTFPKAYVCYSICVFMSPGTLIISFT